MNLLPLLHCLQRLAVMPHLVGLQTRLRSQAVLWYEVALSPSEEEGH